MKMVIYEPPPHHHAVKTSHARKEGTVGIMLPPILPPPSCETVPGWAENASLYKGWGTTPHSVTIRQLKPNDLHPRRAR